MAAPGGRRPRRPDYSHFAQLAPQMEDIAARYTAPGAPPT
jgi:hypothetical protein